MKKSIKRGIVLFIALLITITIMAQQMKKSKTFIVSESEIINVPQDQLWKITAIGFAEISKWASAVDASSGVGNGIGLEGAVCNERVCDPSIKRINQTTESFLLYDAKSYTFKYEIKHGLPKIIKRAVNEWKHVKVGDATRITMNIELEIEGFFANLMKGLMVKKMKKDLRGIMEELKFYAETGNIHPRKIKRIAEYELEQSKKQQS